MARTRSPHRPRSLAPIPYVAGIDYDVLDELLGYSLRRAQVAMFMAFDAAACGLDITPPRFTALCLVGANPGIAQAELGTVLGIARSGATPLADWMQGRGYVERRRRPGDARAWGLHLTGPGERFVRMLKQRVLGKDRERSAHLSPRERRELLRLLAKLAA
jgi:DNA-binding MarR family transcriptional regulator